MMFYYGFLNISILFEVIFSKVTCIHAQYYLNDLSITNHFQVPKTVANSDSH